MLWSNSFSGMGMPFLNASETPSGQLYMTISSFILKNEFCLFHICVDLFCQVDYTLCLNIESKYISENFLQYRRYAKLEGLRYVKSFFRPHHELFLF